MTATIFGAARVHAIPSGGLVELLAIGQSLGAVDLATGIPGSPDTPRPLIEAAVTELRTGSNQYEHPNGHPALRRRIAESLASEADPDTEITVTVGASEALCVALLSTVDPGDEVILLEPFYENFLTAVAVAGGIPKYVRLRSPDWRWDSAELAAAFGPRTRAIVLNSPSNPTGKVLGYEELAELAELCERWNVTVVSDEVYSSYVYDGRKHVSVADVPGLRERSIVLGSLSKSHALSGWRLGFLRAPAPITSALRRVHIATSCGTAGPFQRAAAAAHEFDLSIWRPIEQMQRQRDDVVAMFTAAGFGCVPPEGGCYLFADITGVTTEDCATFAERTVTERGLLLSPGRFFFEDHNGDSGRVRIAFNKTPETLAAARQRLSDPGALT